MRVRFKNPSSLMVAVSLSRGTGVIFAQTQEHFFLDKIQTQHSQTQVHKNENLFFVKGMLMAPLVTAGVSDDVAQELQMPIVPRALDDVEEPIPSRPVTHNDPGTPDQTVLDQQSLTHFPSQPWCKVCPHREQQWCHNFSLTTATWRMESSADCMIPRGNRHLFKCHTRYHHA